MVITLPSPKRQRLDPLSAPKPLAQRAPHAREHCTQFVFSPPINDTSHRLNLRYCPSCFCFVCDRPVQSCPVWPLHCMALHHEPLWQSLRNSTRPGKNVLPVPITLLPPRAARNFSMRRFIHDAHAHNLNQVELIDLTVDHQPNALQQQPTNQLPSSSPVAAPSLPVSIPDDSPQQCPAPSTSVKSADVSPTSVSPALHSSSTPPSHSPSPMPSNPHSPLPSFLSETPSQSPASLPSPEPTLHQDQLQADLFQFQLFNMMLGADHSNDELNFSPPPSPPPSLPTLPANHPGLVKFKSVWKIQAPLELLRPKKMLKDVANQSHAGAPWTRLFVGSIHLWRPYCSHLSATHVKQTLGRGDKDVTSLFNKSHARMSGCSPAQAELFAREMGLDLLSSTLFGEMMPYYRLGIGGSVDTVSKLPNYTDADKNPVSERFVSNLNKAMRSGLVDIVWNISHHDGHKKENKSKAFSCGLGSQIESLQNSVAKHLVKEQIDWLQERQTRVNKLEHFNSSNCCSLRLDVYLTPAAFASINVNAASFLSERSIHGLMTPIDGNESHVNPTAEVLSKHNLSLVMTIPKKTERFRSILSVLQPVHHTHVDGQQPVPPPKDDSRRSLLDVKLYESEHKFASISVTDGLGDVELRKKGEDIMKELNNISAKYNYDTGPDVLHEAILRSDAFTVSTGYRRAEPQPPNVGLPLRLYQRESLAWMLDREQQRSLSDPFWIPFTTVDRENLKRTMYYCPLTGTVSAAQPPPVVGGVLAEEMGLGKTIIVISLIDLTLKQACQNRFRRGAHERKDLLPTSATLIVCPVSLLKQWEQEFKTKLRKPLRVLTWYGNRTKDPEVIASYDVVLTTYGILSSYRYEELTKLHWYRVVIDESTYLRGGGSNCAGVLSKELVSSRRWAVSGTPFGNHFASFRGTMRFLGVVPFSTTHDFELISAPFVSHHRYSRRITGEQDGPKRLPQLAYVLKNLVMRHVKDQMFRGNVLVKLPPASGTLVRVKSSKIEARTYNNIERDVQRATSRKLDKAKLGRGDVLPLMQGLLPLRMMADGIMPDADDKAKYRDPNRISTGFRAQAASKQLPGGLQNKAKIRQLINDVSKYRSENLSNKFVIFSEFRDVQVAIQEELEAAGHVTFTLDGAMTAVKRGKVIRQFSEDMDAAAMIFSMRLGACGLTLTMANFVVLFDVGLDNALELQAVNRTHRIGQTRAVRTLTYVTEGTVDERIMDVRRKRGLPRYFGDTESTENNGNGEEKLSKMEELRCLYNWSPC